MIQSWRSGGKYSRRGTKHGTNVSFCPGPGHRKPWRVWINRYEDLLHKNWDLATDEQKARVAQIKAQTERLERESQDDDGEEGVEIINDAPKPKEAD